MIVTIAFAVVFLLLLTSVAGYFDISGPNGGSTRLWHGALTIRWNPDHFTPAPISDWRFSHRPLNVGQGGIPRIIWLPGGGRIAMVVDPSKSSLATFLSYIEIPGWMVVLPVAIWLVFAWRFERRCRAPGSCVECGYKREGLPKDSPCPECGSNPV